MSAVPLLPHLRGAATWVGGMLFVMIILRPAVSMLTAPDWLLMAAICIAAWFGLFLALRLATVDLGAFA